MLEPDSHEYVKHLGRMLRRQEYGEERDSDPNHTFLGSCPARPRCYILKRAWRLSRTLGPRCILIIHSISAGLWGHTRPRCCALIRMSHLSQAIAPHAAQVLCPRKDIATEHRCRAPP